MADVFRTTIPTMGEMAVKATPSPVCLAGDVMGAVVTNEYGVTDNLIPEMAEALGHDGLGGLQARLMESRDRRWSAAPPRLGGVHHYDYTLAKFSLALQAVADALGDVDAYMDALSDRDPTNPVFASQIAIRLVAVGRAEEAMADWSLTSLQLKLIKIGARVGRHARAITFQLAEVAVTGPMVRAILAAIHRLRAPPSCV